jgi:hypothetical protein
MIKTAVAWALGPALPYVIGAVIAALALCAWTINDRAYDRGVSHERGAWEKEATRLRAVAASEAAQRAQAVAGAETAAKAASVALDALAAETRKDADAYYQTRPAARRACLDPVRLRAIAAADRAALAAAGATR